MSFFWWGGRMLAIAWSQNWLILACLFSCRQKPFLREAHILRAWKKEEITALQNMCCHWATKTPTQTPLATMMCCLCSEWFIVYTLKMEAECNHVLNLNIFIYIFIALYLPLKYCTDGPMAVVDCRNIKLFLNKGSCVLIDSKRYVFKHCTNIPGSTPFHFSLSIQCVEYIDRNSI